MQNEAENEKTRIVGEMQKRRATTADGKRYLIYYTFGDGGGNDGAQQGKRDEKIPEIVAHNAAVEEEDVNV